MRARIIKWLTRNKEWFKVPDFPTHIGIETSSDCNLRCKSCPRTYSKRARVNMPIELAEKILKEIKKERPKIEELSLHCYGEPLVNPQIFEIINMARKYLPTTKLSVSSNSVLLTKENVDKLVDSNITSIAMWEKEGKVSTKNNMLYFLDKMKGTEKQVQIGYLLFKNNGGKTMYDFIKEFEEYLEYDNIVLRVMETHDFGGYTKGKDDQVMHTSKKFAINTPCAMPFNMCIVYATGEIVPCCMDMDAKMSGGNIKNTTIKEAWHSPKFNRLREQLLDGKVSNEFNCKTCHYYKQQLIKTLEMFLHGRTAYNWEIGGKK